VEDVVGALRDRFPDVVGPHAADICYATHNRQEAVSAIAADCDLVLVVGSANSSNSNRLVEVARRAGVAAYLVDDDTGLELEWFADAARVGVTAGASAPETLVERVLTGIRGLGTLTIEHRDVRQETVNFPLPLEVR
jgi:4-hydroxy-3-methylbut-2-enyl diphosphate reductase